MNHSVVEPEAGKFEDVFPEVFPFSVRQEPGPDNLLQDTLRSELRECLLHLSYSAFLHVIAQLLTLLGHRNVHQSGRKGFVGRNRGGGWDLETVVPPAHSLAGVQPGIRCIIQAKQFTELSVQQRTVDELRGCCLRTGAGQGILITTSQFSPVAKQAAEASVLAPITLIDGERLRELLVHHRLGLIRAKSGKWQADAAYFQTLEATSNASSASKGIARMPRPQHEGLPSRLMDSRPAFRNNTQPTVLHFSITLSPATMQNIGIDLDAGKNGNPGKKENPGKSDRGERSGKR